MERLDKEMINISGRMGSWMAQDFITLLRMACNLKLMSCYFWNFPFNVFRPLLTMGNYNQRSETTDKRGLLYQEWNTGGKSDVEGQ